MIDTMAELRLAIAAKHAEEKPRDYIGASMMGHECSRAIWYSGNNTKGQAWPVKTLLKFEDGHRTEDLMAERLRMLPFIRLHSQQAEIDLGFIKGHIDGVIEGLCESIVPHVWECKAVDEDGFKKLQKAVAVHGEYEAMKQWEHRYYVQAVLYMHGMGISRHYLTVATPGGRDFMAVRTRENPAYAKSIIERGRRIAQSKEPPEKISLRPDHWQCRLCQYAGVCHK
jgi:CRISPR/Cas system-associated exonuclease Cas4 (RecB family)